MCVWKFEPILILVWRQQVALYFTEDLGDLASVARGFRSGVRRRYPDAPLPLLARQPLCNQARTRILTLVNRPVHTSNVLQRRLWSLDNAWKFCQRYAAHLVTRAKVQRASITLKGVMKLSDELMIYKHENTLAQSPVSVKRMAKISPLNSKRRFRNFSRRSLYKYSIWLVAKHINYLFFIPVFFTPVQFILNTHDADAW